MESEMIAVEWKATVFETGSFRKISIKKLELWTNPVIFQIQ